MWNTIKFACARWFKKNALFFIFYPQNIEALDFMCGYDNFPFLEIKCFFAARWYRTQSDSASEKENCFQMRTHTYTVQPKQQSRDKFEAIKDNQYTTIYINCSAVCCLFKNAQYLFFKTLILCCTWQNSTFMIHLDMQGCFQTAS